MITKIFTQTFLFLSAAILFTRGAESNSLPQREFSHPDRIRYDSHCLTIDGKDVFIFSGAFHYFRCPKELWPDRFQKIKDAGFNCVESYAAWNWSEQQMPSGTNDFSKVNVSDLDEWLTMAEQYGFYVIVRPGPYICAEWDTGGYPQWLLTKKPENPLRSEGWLRSDDPVYLAWCKHWYDAVCPVIAKHQITRNAPGKPGVILVQVENEYDYARFSDDVKANQVRALVEFARADGIDAPLITCWTHQVRGSTDPMLRQIFDCANFYPRWDVNSVQGDIEKLRREQPDAPLATTELQGGWFAQVGGKLSEEQDGVTASQINNLTLFAIQDGETLLNYYMLFGGTNPGDRAARNITSTYDYNAPIREWGGVGDRYQRVWALGHMLKEHGAKLARSESVECDARVPQKDVTVIERRAQDGSRYLFIRTSQHEEPREGVATVKEKSGDTNGIVFDYQLEPFGAKILYLPPGATNSEQGQWLPKAAPEIELPKNLPAGVAITSAKMRADPGPSHWTKLSAAEMLAQAGIYGSDFVFYQAEISSRKGTNLMVEFPDGDAVLATVNGEVAADSGGAARAVFELPKGSSKVRLLYENHGFANGGKEMERQGGIIAAQLVNSAQIEGSPIGGWRMHEVDGAGKRPEVQADFNDDHWTNVDVSALDANQLWPDRIAVFRARIEMTEAGLKNAKWDLNFGRIDDAGWIYVNGTGVGKTTDWSQSYSFEVTKHLRAGTNVIAVVVRNDGGGGGLGAPTLMRELEASAVPLQSLGMPMGIENQWWQPDFKDQNWKTILIGPGAAEANLLTWYRMNFQLPSPTPGVWVPWRLHLNASGNGFLYLNGHVIGRYWEVGPQHDFFLPECWLNFGEGKSNVIALDLRPLKKGASIESASVEPYAGSAILSHKGLN